MIDGCIAWQRDGLSPPDAVLEASNDYVDAQELLQQSIDERCNTDAGFPVPYKRFVADYNSFRSLEGMFSLNATQITNDMEKKGFLKKRIPQEDGSKPFCFVGVKLVDISVAMPPAPQVPVLPQ